MKIILFLVLSLPIFADGPAKPDWAKRQKTKIQKGDTVRFLGVAESISLDKAKKESKMDAYLQLTELSTDKNQIMGKTVMQNSLNSSRSDTDIAAISPILKVDFENFEQYWEKVDGKWIVYTDAIVKKGKLEKSIKEAVMIPAKKMYPEYFDSFQTSEINEDYERSKTLLDKHWSIRWAPITTDGFYILDLGLEYNILRRLISIETFYSLKSDTKDSNGSLTEEITTTRQKYGATLFFSPYRKFNKTFSIGLGYQTKRDDLERDSGANETETIRKSSDNSPIVKIRYRKSFEDSGWGYEINLKFEDEEEIKNNTAAIGFFYSF